MLSSLFAAIVCVAIPVGDPLEVPAQSADGEAPIELGVHLTATSFRARNFSDAMQLLVFSNDNGQPIFVALPVGGTVEYSFPPEALPGTRFEVVSLRDSGWKTTGYHTLSVPLQLGEETLWTQPGATRLHTWLQLGCEVSEIPAEGTLLPPGFLDQGSSIETMVAPTHVPVITSSGGTGGNVPPPIGPSPLPPV